MDQAGIIRDLLIWLEGHLDSPLALDNVAAKAGYSKWHLQRMFKEVTGHAIGAYIRARRLSKSAVALRLTTRPILDIALQYRFDSQQTFTRAFKKQFQQTPAIYRRSPLWNTFGMHPPLRLSELNPPRGHFVTLPETQLLGVTQNYSCALEQISDLRHEMRIQFWMQFLDDSSALPAVLYGLHESRPSEEKTNQQEVFYTTALNPESAREYLPQPFPVMLQGGDYVQFNYEGPGSGLQNFILTLYDTCVPSLNITRRTGQDIERLFLPQSARLHHQPMQLRCEYLIPVSR